MTLAQRKVLILAAGDFEDMELLYRLYRLAEEDIAVTMARLDDHPVRGKKGHGPVPVDTTVAQRPRADGKMVTGFQPAVSPDALKTMSQQVRHLRTHTRTRHDLNELAALINPVAASSPDTAMDSLGHGRTGRLPRSAPRQDGMALTRSLRG